MELGLDSDGWGASIFPKVMAEWRPKMMEFGGGIFLLNTDNDLKMYPLSIMVIFHCHMLVFRG